jgi:hypothetical protein
VKEMRLAGIDSILGANHFLETRRIAYRYLIGSHRGAGASCFSDLVAGGTGVVVFGCIF